MFDDSHYIPLAGTRRLDPMIDPRFWFYTYCCQMARGPDMGMVKTEKNAMGYGL